MTSARQPRTARLYFAAALALAASLLVAHLARADAGPASAGTARLAALAGDVTAADGHRYDARDDTGRTMDAAQIEQAQDGRYLAVYHTLLADGRFHAAVATSTDLRHWQRRQRSPTTAAAATSSPMRRTPATTSPCGRTRTPPRCSRAAPGTPSTRRAPCRAAPRAPPASPRCAARPSSSPGTDRQLRATLTGFRHWHAEPDRRLDRAVRSRGNGGNIGDRAPVELGGQRVVLIEGQGRRGDFGTWSTYAYDPPSGRADRLDIRTHGGSRAFANPSATLLTDPRGEPALLMSLFVPAEGSAPGESGQLLYWRELGK
ncbi:hypothetical protein [Streptomyces flavofungini]|uniref:hypothetical protein n=1 Tax=Streptomyces flavofungini TaxID=68200 RepID=UPI0034DF417F